MTQEEKDLAIDAVLGKLTTNRSDYNLLVAEFWSASNMIVDDSPAGDTELPVEIISDKRIPTPVLVNGVLGVIDYGGATHWQVEVDMPDGAAAAQASMPCEQMYDLTDLHPRAVSYRVRGTFRSPDGLPDWETPWSETVTLPELVSVVNGCVGDIRLRAANGSGSGYGPATTVAPFGLSPIGCDFSVGAYWVDSFGDGNRILLNRDNTQPPDHSVRITHNGTEFVAEGVMS